MILKKKRILFLISLTQLQPIKKRHITESWTRVHNTQDLTGAKYDPEKETHFVFDLTDSVAAYQREAHYRVVDHRIHYTLDLGDAKYRVFF